MGLRALYPPRTSQPGGRTHGVSVPAEGPVHRATESCGRSDICLHPDGARVLSLVAIMDWYSRRVLALAGIEHPRSATSVSKRSRRADPRATGDLQYGPRRPVHVPSVYDGAQSPRGCHQHGRQTVGRWVDNVFVERLWRSVKYEDGISMRSKHPPRCAGLTDYFQFYMTGDGVTVHLVGRRRMWCLRATGVGTAA